MSDQRTLYTNARLIDAATGLDETGALLTEGKLIVDLGPNVTASDATVIDCGGHILSPGLIDMRVFVGEPGAEHKETLKSASESAAAGGVTTLIVMPDTNPVIDDASLVDFIERRSRDTAIVNVHPMGALTIGLEGKAMSEMALLAEAGAVAFTHGKTSITDSQLMRRALEYASGIGALIVHHAEDPSLSNGACMNEGELATRLGLIGAPHQAESIMVERDLALVELTGARYHLAQISCEASLEAILKAKRRGLNVTCAVSAHHLSLNENDIATYRTFFKTRPPLRSEETRMALLQALKDGTIDVVTSSHDPQGPEDKRLPFSEAMSGTVGLESLLPVMLEFVHNEHLTLHEALAAVTLRPAEVLGLKAGRLAKGAPADLTIIDLGHPYIFDASKLKSKSKNSPFDERRFQGCAIRTVVGGKTVFEANQES